MKSATRAWAFLTLLSLTLIVLGHLYGGREGLLFALILTLSVNSFVYFYEDRRVLSKLGGHELEGQDSHGLHEKVARLAAHARIKSPRIVILPDLAPQAGVVGRGVTHGTIILTQGCLNKFSAQELEAILAYQVASIRSLNTLAFAVGSFISSLGLFITESLDLFVRLLIIEKKNPDNFVSQLFTRLFAPLFGGILRLSMRPSMFFYADSLATKLLPDPKIMARVIWKFESFSQTLPYTPPISMAHLFIVSPLTSVHWMHWLKVQPAPAERIRNLIGYYPV